MHTEGLHIRSEGDLASLPGAFSGVFPHVADCFRSRDTLSLSPFNEPFIYKNQNDP
jgi:hypothetical protein